MTGNEDQRAQSQRLDKWLWFARMTKSRTLAAQLIEDGKVRINRAKAAKASQIVRTGDVLTITLRGSVEVVKVLAPGVRRGPPPEARLLYEAILSAGSGAPGQATQGRLHATRLSTSVVGTGGPPATTPKAPRSGAR
jgi:ribosome-associated heat shock protein Hsp15